VLPALVRLINLTQDPCGAPDVRLLARPAAPLRTATYYLRAAGAASCVAVAVDVPKPPWSKPGVARPRDASAASSVRAFQFTEIVPGRYLWRASDDPVAGELLELKPFPQGVQVGEARWFRDEAACRRAKEP
jgi:hypothetical protein